MASSASSNNPFREVTAVETVQLSAKALHAGLAREVEQRLVQRLQGRCSRHGYVGRVRVHSIHSASISVLTCALQGSVSVPATVELAVAWPVPGDVLRGRVRSRNAFGLAFTCSFEGVDVVHAVVPRQAACRELASDTGVGPAALGRLSPGDCAWIQILGVKHLQDRIHATARVVSGPGVPLPESLRGALAAKVTEDGARPRHKRHQQRHHHHLEDDQCTTAGCDEDSSNANEDDPDVEGDADAPVRGSSSDGGGVCDQLLVDDEEVFVYDEGDDGDVGMLTGEFLMAGAGNDDSDDDQD